MSKVSFAILAVLAMTAPAGAANLYQGGNWSALAADRNAYKAGDALMVVIYESAQASDSASSGSSRGNGFGGQIGVGNVFNQSASLSTQSQSNNSGSVGHSGGMVAQISVVVDDVMSNGDLHVSGAQVMNINGSKTNIRIKGRVRPSDILPGNAVLSSRLADAAIDYDGSGFVMNSAQSGLITRIFNWLGL